MKTTSTDSAFEERMKPGFYVGTVIAITPAKTICKNNAWLDEGEQERIDILTPQGNATTFLQTKAYKNARKGGNPVTSADLSIGAQKILAASKPMEAQQMLKGLLAKEFAIRSSVKDNGESNEEMYFVNIKTNLRVVDTVKTADVCQKIANKFTFACGVPEGEEVDTFDMVGAEIGIEIVDKFNSNGKAFSHVKQFLTVEQATAKMEAAMNEAQQHESTSRNRGVLFYCPLMKYLLIFCFAMLTACFTDVQPIRQTVTLQYTIDGSDGDLESMDNQMHYAQLIERDQNHSTYLDDAGTEADTLHIWKY